MSLYPNTFIEIVRYADEKAKEFYQQHDKSTTPNPFYIGKGNPNAKILVIGKELAIDPTENNDVFINESVENTSQWKKIVEANSTYSEVAGFNPLLPYNGDLPKSPGATWNQYQRLCDLLHPRVKASNESHFFHNFFLTEVNTAPSKSSPGRSNIEFGERLEFLKQEFYQSFKIVLIATGGYLHVEQIEDIFGVKELDRSQSTANSKFITFTNTETGKKAISTRQLSTSVSLELMNKITLVINS